MRRYLGSRSSAALSLGLGLILGASGCGGSSSTEASPKTAEAVQSSRSAWEQAKANGTDRIKHAAPTSSGSAASSGYQRRN